MPLDVGIVVDGNRWKNIMIMINRNWEQVKDLSDILRIVSENIGDEFARKVEEIFKKIRIQLQEESENLFIEVLDMLGDSLDDNKYKQYIENINSIFDKI